MTGFVSFVSSGPGDPDLLTLKAARLLGRAQVVLYDDLSGGPILDLVPPEAELIAVGKRAGQPSTKQDHINRLLVDHAQAEAHVVRLKSGDAGIFGRLEEEIIALTQAGIAFEVVPGVTASSAAAAAAQIPLTRRHVARRFQVITGHGSAGGLPAGLNWPALVDEDAVTAVYMARATAPALAQQLMERGVSPDCAVMMVIQATRPDQHIHRCTMSQVSRTVAELHTHPGAFLFLYGALMQYR